MEEIQPLKTMKHSRNTLKVQTRKRKFLISLIGLFGVIPFFQFFKEGKYKSGYFFCASLIGEYLSKESEGRYMKNKAFKILNSKMLSQKKLLKFKFTTSKEKTSWFYLFDSKKSYLEWKEQVYEYKMFSIQSLPKHLRYSQKQGFFHNIPDKGLAKV